MIIALIPPVFFFLFLCASSGSFPVEDVNAKLLITLIMLKLLRKQYLTQLTRKKTMMSGQLGCSEITCTNKSQIEKMLIDIKYSSKDDSTHSVEHLVDISDQVCDALTTNEALFSGPKMPKYFKMPGLN